MQNLAESEEDVVGSAESRWEFLSRLPNSVLIASGVGCLFAVLLIVSVGYNYQQSKSIKIKTATAAKLKKEIGERDAKIERLEVDRQSLLGNDERALASDQYSEPIDDIIASGESSAAERQKAPTVAPDHEASKVTAIADENKATEHPSPKIVNGECQLTTNAINKDPAIIIGCIRMMNDNDPLAPQQQRGKTKPNVVPG